MKKIYLATITISLGLGVLFPWCVYKVFGFFWNSVAVDESYVDRAALLIMLTLLLTAAAVLLSRHGRKPINFSEAVKSRFLSGKAAEQLFMAAIVLNLVNAARVGDFSGLISGEANGSIISYLQLFLDLRILYYLALLRAYKRKRIGKILLYSFLYVGVSVLYSSRSGAFWVVFFNLILIVGVKISRALKQKILMLIMAAVILAPFLYAFSTISRGGAQRTVEYMAKQIVARLSYIESGGIELQQYTEKTYDEVLFREKYGLKNQVEQTINSLLPGDIFENDVYPNQYWRAIFAGWEKEAAKMHYTSSTMILPVYFYLKYGGLLGIVLCILFCYGLFWGICRIKDVAVAAFMASYTFYTIFQYFDWAYHARDLTCFLLTFLTVRIYSHILEKVKFQSRYPCGKARSICYNVEHSIEK